MSGDSLLCSRVAFRTRAVSWEEADGSPVKPGKEPGQGRAPGETTRLRWTQVSGSWPVRDVLVARRRSVVLIVGGVSVTVPSHSCAPESPPGGSQGDQPSNPAAESGRKMAPSQNCRPPPLALRDQGADG